jgi:hypothetical protein
MNQELWAPIFGLAGVFVGGGITYFIERLRLKEGHKRADAEAASAEAAERRAACRMILDEVVRNSATVRAAVKEHRWWVSDLPDSLWRAERVTIARTTSRPDWFTIVAPYVLMSSVERIRQISERLGDYPDPSDDAAVKGLQEALAEAKEALKKHVT